MNVTTSYRPIISSWAELAGGGGMTKEAVDWLGLAKKMIGPVWKATGAPLIKNVLKPTWTATVGARPGVLRTGAGLLGAPVAGYGGWWGGNVLNNQLSEPTRTVLGNVATGGTYGAVAREAKRQSAAADAKIKAVVADAAEKNAPPGPDPIAEGLGTAKNWAVKNWPLLAAGGLGLGGAGLWMKNRADRKREEEEEELLTGMHPKAAMFKLAAEFPVQVGFLARCGERRLTGAEVREAIEKCAALSDGIAEDWIHFFDAAAGLEAGDPSRLMKAAVSPIPAPKPPDPVEQPKIPPTKTTGGGFAATAAAKPPPAVTPPVPPPPMLTARDLRNNAPEDPYPQLEGEYRLPRGTPVPPLTDRDLRNNAPEDPYPRLEGEYRQPMPANAAAPTPAAPAPEAPTPEAQAPATTQPYLTNTQVHQTTAPSGAGIMATKLWSEEISRLSKEMANTDPNLMPEQRAALKAKMNALQENPPARGPAMGAAGLDRELPGELEMRNLKERAPQERTDAVRDLINNITPHKWVPTVGGVNADQEQMVRRINEGMAPEQAQRMNASSAENDPTMVSYARNTLTAAPDAMAGIAAMPAALLADARHPLQMENTSAVARDIASLFTRGLGPAHAEALQTGGRSMAHNIMPELATKLKGISTATPNSPGGDPGYLARTAAGIGGTLAENYRPLAGMMTGGAAMKGLSGALEAAPWLAGAANWTGRAMTGLSGGSGIALGVDQAAKQLPGEGGLSETQSEGIKQKMDAARRGDIPYTADQIPTNLDPVARAEWKATAVQGSIRAQNEQRKQHGQPLLNPAEVKALTDRQSKPIDEVYKAQDQTQFATHIPGMAGPAGPDGKPTYNPLGKIDLTQGGFDPRNTLTYMTPERTQAIQTLHSQDKEKLGTLMQGLDPDVAVRIKSGQPMTPADTAVLQAKGINPAEASAVAQRVATAGTLITSLGFNGDMAAAQKFMSTPTAMIEAAKKDGELAAAAEQKVKTGEAPDMMTGLKQTWDGLGSMGQMLVGGGLAVGLFGLISSIMGEGGMGSMMATLLGGGAMVLGANKGGMLPQGMSNMINPVLHSLGLDALGGGKPAAPPATSAAAPNAAGVPTVTPPTVTLASPELRAQREVWKQELAELEKQIQAPGIPPERQVALKARMNQVRSNPPEEAAPAAPPTGGAAGGAAAVDFTNPAERDRLAAAPPVEQDAVMRDKLQDETFRAGIERASWFWQNHPDDVLKGAQDLIPGITMPQMKTMIESYRRTTGKPY